MASTDWAVCSGGLSETDVLRGPTAGSLPPTGGGTHVYGFRSVTSVAGACGLHCALPDFAPTPAGKGGRISGAIKRGVANASNGLSAFLFFCAQGSGVGSPAYLLGLSDEASSHLELRKGNISDGLPAPAVIEPNVHPNILMRSTDTFEPGTWQHLRLDVIVQGTGDVILQVFRNDLTLHTVELPVWEAVPGMQGPSDAYEGFVDDILGVNTASAPFSSGHMGYGCRFDQANRVAYFDHLTIERQL